MKKVILILVMAVMLLALCSCAVTNQNGRTLNAKIRYFDGSSEMIQIKQYTADYGHVLLETEYGDKIRVGWNNVIIIDEVKDE